MAPCFGWYSRSDVAVPLQSFLDGLAEPVRAAAGVLPDLAAQLDAMYAVGRDAWPDVELPAHTFVSHLAAHLDGEDLATQLGAIRPDDLYLACACAQAIPAALAAFDRAFGSQIDRALARAGTSGRKIGHEEFRQLVREKLFVGDAPKIRGYGGKGALRSWVRVTAVRTMLDHVRRREDPGDASDGGGILEVLPTAGADPELDYIRRAYADQIPVALRAAFAGLTARQRNVLRQRFLHGLSAERLATVYGVHRATAFRWLEMAREALLSGLRTRLMEQLQLSGRGLDSLIADMGSRLDVSIAGLLDGDLEPDAGEPD